MAICFGSHHEPPDNETARVVKGHHTSARCTRQHPTHDTYMVWIKLEETEGEDRQERGELEGGEMEGQEG